MYDPKLILSIAYEAGQILLTYFNRLKEKEISIKDDGSSVTLADQEAHNYLIHALGRAYPDTAIVSEENSVAVNMKNAEQLRYFVIDPLDGTDAFIKGMPEFVINIALMENGIPVFGLIYLPVEEVAYYTDIGAHVTYKVSGIGKKIAADKEGKESEDTSIKLTGNQAFSPEQPLVVALTRRQKELEQLKPFIQNLNIKQLIHVSGAVKFCYVAENSVDLYLRGVRIKWWDVAAGHALIKGSQGDMWNYKGQSLSYVANTGFAVEPFIAAKNQVFDWYFTAYLKSLL